MKAVAFAFVIEVDDDRDIETELWESLSEHVCDLSADVDAEGDVEFFSGPVEVALKTGDYDVHPIDQQRRKEQLMYANLEVTTSKGKRLAAWQVKVEPDGRAKVHLDRQDGSGKYAEEGGVLVLHPPFTIRADF